MFSVFFVFDPMQLFKLLFKANHGTPFFFFKVRIFIVCKVKLPVIGFKTDLA